MSELESIVEQVKAANEIKAAEQVKARKALLLDVVQGKLTNPVELLKQMASVGLSVEELEAFQKQYALRVELYQQATAGKDAEAELVKHREKVSAYDAEWKAIWDKHQQDYSQLRYKTQELATLISSSDAAKKNLRLTIGDEVRAKLEALERESRLESRELDKIKESVEIHEAAYRENREMASRDQLTEAAVEDLPASLVRLEAKKRAADEQRAKCAAINAKIEEILNGEALEPATF